MICRVFISLILALSLIVPQYAFAAATLLPPGEQCFQALTGVNGMVGALGTITGGTGGTAGTYANVSLTGGSGSGATANITVSGGAVTVVTILSPGAAYVVGDALSAASASIGNTSGFSVVVNSVQINSSLAGGQVYYYQPATVIFKQTWGDAAQTILNTNPVKLDANGCATVYGTGSYRQVVQDSLGNTVWDKVTTDTSANNNTFWAGTAGGTANAITVVDAGFNATDGSIIQFIPIATNTGATTLNPSSFGAIPVVKDTASGPVALSGGEIAISAGLANVIDVVYSASQNNFHILNLISAATSPSTPACSATGLKITNDSTFPSSKINITADQVIMQTTLGTYISRNSVSVSVNFTTSGANGLDTGTVAATNWYNIYVIDNGVAPAGLGSLSATAPTMPSAYSYKCRLGAVQTDSSTNFYRVIQLGNKSQYQLVSGSNTANTGAAPLLIASGTAGSFSGTSPTLATVTVTGAGFCAPPTATGITINISTAWKGSSNSEILVAPSTAWGGTNNGPAGSNGNIFPAHMATAAANGISQQAMLNLEATTIAWASNAAGGALSCQGWVDKVNAS